MAKIKNDFILIIFIFYFNIKLLKMEQSNTTTKFSFDDKALKFWESTLPEEKLNQVLRNMKFSFEKNKNIIVLFDWSFGDTYQGIYFDKFARRSRKIGEKYIFDYSSIKEFVQENNLSPRLIIGPYYNIDTNINKFPDKRFFNAIIVLTKEYFWNFIKIEYKNKHTKSFRRTITNPSNIPGYSRAKTRPRHIPSNTHIDHVVNVSTSSNPFNALSDDIPIKDDTDVIIEENPQETNVVKTSVVEEDEDSDLEIEQ